MFSGSVRRFLLRLAELELIDCERRIKAARFPVVKSLDSLNFKATPSLNKALVHELMEARDDKQLLRFQKRLAGLKLLIVDELGFVPLSKTGAELLFEVFSRRYGRPRDSWRPPEAPGPRPPLGLIGWDHRQAR